MSNGEEEARRTATMLFQKIKGNIVAGPTITAQPPAPPVPPSFDGERSRGDDGGMEAKIAQLETKVELMKEDISELRVDMRAMRGDIASIRTTDFRLLFGATITVALGLAGLMGKGFHWF
jgi:hypothetical protein